MVLAIVRYPGLPPVIFVSMDARAIRDKVIWEAGMELFEALKERHSIRAYAMLPVGYPAEFPAIVHGGVGVISCL